MNEMNNVMSERKWYDKDDFASKGVGNTALGLSIGALGIELLRNGGLNNLLGGITGGGTPAEESAFGLYKGYRDADDAIVAKHNSDSFALYKNQRDQFDVLKAQIDEIKTKLAVTDANAAWQTKSIYDAIALESERRSCNDGKIVNYVNSTFVPQYIATMEIGTGSTQSVVYNPLCGGCCSPTM